MGAVLVGGAVFTLVLRILLGAICVAPKFSSLLFRVERICDVGIGCGLPWMTCGAEANVKTIVSPHQNTQPRNGTRVV